LTATAGATDDSFGGGALPQGRSNFRGKWKSPRWGCHRGPTLPEQELGTERGILLRTKRNFGAASGVRWGFLLCSGWGRWLWRTKHWRPGVAKAVPFSSPSTPVPAEGKETALVFLLAALRFLPDR
jgi:hypothetical protein